MFILYADKPQLHLRQREPLTSGSVNIYTARFDFSLDWDGLTRTAVFRAGTESRAVLLDDTGQCSIPWEVLTVPGIKLYAGVCGTRDGEVVLPTVWADLGKILEGADCGAEHARPPTPDLWEQELARKADRLDYTPDGELGLYAGDKLLSAVPVQGGGEGGGPGYIFGHGLKVTGATVSVDAVSDFDGDNTLPMAASGVQTIVGNIEQILATI